MNRQNQFERRIPVDSSQLVRLTVNEVSYPLYLTPGNTLTIRAARGEFPAGVEVEGYPDAQWDRNLNRYLQKSLALQRQASAWESSFHRGRSDSLLSFYRRRAGAARTHLNDTPFKPLTYRANGAYLVKQLQYLQNRIYHQNIDPSSLNAQRKRILQRAKAFDFFTFRSLWAQRAGIYDFANAYALSFGIEKKLERRRGQKLMIYDVKRLAYPTLDSLKRSLLTYIDGQRALAYARMYLVAERIGELSLQRATPSYKQYVRDYGEEFPRFVSFLKDFYNRRKKVSPGHAAVPFSLPNPEGDLIRMRDFRGKYVLLDFWASWCIPCLNEFPHMKDLYRQYPRSSFEIVSISIEKDSLRWRRALQRFDLPWPQAYGGNGFQQKTFSAYQAGGIPFYVLVGPDGNIQRYNDIRPSFNLEGILDSLIHDTQNPEP